LTKAPNPIKGGAPNGAGHLAAPKWGRLAQLVEQLTLNQRVVGSNPSASTIQVIYFFVFKQQNVIFKNMAPLLFPHFDWD
jgi:hypothetical protein